ncbi:MAG: hypothetical protein BroJett020_02200 [Bacteroidota bacterium]|nr:MAG: hypothetical protein BroJett020_02200 [Bacteroidota bacterium]
MRTPVTREVIVTTDSSVIKTVVKIEKRKKNYYKLSRQYYWYSANKIQQNTGEYYGQCLHGYFKEFNYSGQMLRSGNMQNGLKNGTWKKWNDKGFLMSYAHWKKGRMHGNFYQALSDGSTINGKHRQDKMHGKVVYSTLENPMQKTVVFYRKGEKIIVPEVGKKGFLHFKKNQVSEKENNPKPDSDKKTKTKDKKVKENISDKRIHKQNETTNKNEKNEKSKR